MKTIGIIGGAGPMASCRLYQLIIEECQKAYGCVYDEDFPRILIINYPFANMLTMENLQKNRTQLVKQLQACCDQLAVQGAEIIAIACNTLHTLLPDIEVPLSCSLVHIATATLESSHQSNVKKLLILATSTTIGLQLYRAPAIACIAPSAHDQLVVDNVIANILAGSVTKNDSQALSTIVNKNNVDGIALACTELPLLHQRNPLCTQSNIQIFDTLHILAKGIVGVAR